MARTSKKPMAVTADNFVKLLAKKDAIEKVIAKQQKKLEKIKADLKPFKDLVDTLTK